MLTLWVEGVKLAGQDVYSWAGRRSHLIVYCLESTYKKCLREE